MASSILLFTKQFAFYINSGTSFIVEVRFREIMQKNNFLNCYPTGIGQQINNNNKIYVIRYDGYTYSHHDKDVDNKQLSFKFTTNDIIIIEVCIEQKYIKWNRQNNPAATVLQMDTLQELYPCVGVAYHSKIKILDNAPG